MSAMNTENPHAGSLFDDFLKEQGRYEEVTATALKRVLARQLSQAMEQQNISKVEMARRLNTSRSQLDRLLDPENDKVRLDTLQRAAVALGRTLQIDLIDLPRREP